MSLTSLGYVLFLTACVFAYWLLPEKWRRGALLTASMGFYLMAMPAQLPVMLLYLWIVYALGVRIARSKKRRARRWMNLGVVLSVAYLFSFKYLNFALSLFTGGAAALPLVAPMGISYVTFQAISYLVMVYRGETRAAANPALVLLYGLFFPKITAGPIETPDHFFAEVTKKPRQTWKSTLSSVALICVGFAKKVAAADLAAPAVNAVYQAPGAADGLSALLAIALYAAQIYFDFSGYTDIALGSARLFGIHLTENFDRPYAAESVVAFWRRWHISLTAWLRKYVYFPLGGSRVKPGRHYLNVLMTFLVSGLWHGANLTFVFWGLFHGLCQIVEMAWGRLMPRGKPPSRAGLLLGRARTLVLVTVGWVFFRAASLENAFSVLGRLFSGWAAPAQVVTFLNLSVGALAVFLVTALGADRVKRYALSKRMTDRGGVICCVFLTALTLLGAALGAGHGAENSFIYFNF